MGIPAIVKLETIISTYTGHIRGKVRAWNKRMAEQRLQGLKGRLQRHPQLGERYKEENEPVGLQRLPLENELCACRGYHQRTSLCLQRLLPENEFVSVLKGLQSFSQSFKGHQSTRKRFGVLAEATIRERVCVLAEATTRERVGVLEEATTRERVCVLAQATTRERVYISP